jgi:LPS export ABC transporter protein LptC
MKGWRIVLVLVLLGVGAAAFWMSRSQPGQADAGEDGAAPVAYDYEASDVVLRQMGPDGRMAFQIEAMEITQLPDSGKVTARGLTMYHDPPGTEPGGPNRLTLTADSGELPVEGGVVTLTGKVRARGVPKGRRTQMTIATESLRYDMATQELSNDDLFRLNMGGIRVEGRRLRANLQTGQVNFENLKGNVNLDAAADDSRSR